jgi:hypothetical protein
VAGFASATGVHLSYASDYLPGDKGWAGLDQQSRLTKFLGPWQGSPYRLVLGVPVIPEVDGRAVATLAAGAAGSYDPQFTTLARSLVSYGAGNAVLRLGWEFNEPWEPWAVANAADAAHFAGYFRRIVAAMRAVPGTSFQFDWNPAPGPGPIDLALAYPGDASVDLIGLDIYDETWSSPETPSVAWAGNDTGPNGLEWMATFAAAHHKAMSIPEWGVTIRSDGHGLGDDPAFVFRVAAWAASHNVAFVSYFDIDVSDGRHNLLDGDLFESRAEFTLLFGSSGATG